MRVPPTVSKCVAFVGIRNPDPIYGGTAFIVSIDADRINGNFNYLVTAKHVAKALEGRDGIVRVNTKHGSSVVLNGQNIPWLYHPTDDTADIAIVPFNAPDDADVAVIPVTMFTIEEDFAKGSLGVGDEVFITGLFTKSPGDSRNIPIVRTGNLALAANEKIPFGKLGLIDAHLIEGRSIGGLSGSPVFIRQTLPMRTVMKKTGEYRPFLGGGPYYLLGSTIGHWDHEVAAMTAIEAEAVNMGISAVVPASKIHEILFQPEMIEMRKQVEDRRIKNDKSAKLDTALPERSFTQKDFEASLKKASRKMPPKN